MCAGQLERSNIPVSTICMYIPVFCNQNYFLVVRLSTETTNWIIGEKVGITCQHSGSSFEFIEITWFYYDKEILIDEDSIAVLHDFYTGTSVLNTVVDDEVKSGNYTCVASYTDERGVITRYSPLPKSLNIRVKGRP